MNKLSDIRPSLMRFACLIGGLAVAAGCSHGSADTSRKADRALAATRGLCPTDLNQTQMIVREGPDFVAAGFRTLDPSKVEEISRRVAELGEALALVHPAVSPDGKLVQHVPAPRPELREFADGTGNGVELLFRTEPSQKSVLLANLKDHERMWLNGECPVMSDESVHPHETRAWRRVDR